MGFELIDQMRDGGRNVYILQGVPPGDFLLLESALWLDSFSSTNDDSYNSMF